MNIKKDGNNKLPKRGKFVTAVLNFYILSILFLGWRESNPLRFRSKPFSVCFAFFFERRQPFCKLITSHTKKSYSRNCKAPAKQKILMKCEVENRRYTGVFQESKQSNSQNFHLSGVTGLTLVSLSFVILFETALLLSKPNSFAISF